MVGKCRCVYVYPDHRHQRPDRHQPGAAPAGSGHSVFGVDRWISRITTLLSDLAVPYHDFVGGIGDVQLIMLGVVGQYIGLMFQEAKRRPVYWRRMSMPRAQSIKDEEERLYERVT